ncbi:dolichyl-phosphate-mannose-protein mannosyltransferase [Chitinophaga dinghuensis]|uniref:Dolichyl-phosphate-mannose-protein mannosyltransferase n=1 Tax=Chitinophaga dinghuensis TaxID=1539050 RepID=A0A327WEU1_9BACT|nr:glycosyltransferase family 39 protein [Chitinophaga dinghuensis]RAJ87926.1 dolichyl-phosphate-mannose-protein mannosyltransferase [Chitinophaga dinghuensis]
MNESSTNLIGYTKTDRWIFSAVCIIALLRISCIWLMGLMPQDAYYYFYGQHPALSYFDHPPAVAWLTRIFTTIFGRHAFAIKLGDTVVTMLTVWTFYVLAKKFLSLHRSWNALLLLFSTLMVTILSLVTTPDVPLMLFWTVSLICLYKAIFEDKPQWWIWTGLAMGLAFDSKYTAVLLPMGTVLFLLLSGRNRRWLISPWFYGAVVVFVLAISPVIIWNVGNHFASFRFQSSERAHDIEVNWLDVLGVIGHQSAILLPVLFFGICYYLWKALRRYGLRWWRVPDKELWLLCYFLPLFLGFFLISPLYWVKLNWMMPAYITGIIWVSVWLGKRWLRWQYIFSLVVHLALAVEILFYPVPVKSDDTWAGWEGLGEQMQQVSSNYPADFIFSADDYKTSAMLNFYLGRMVYSQEIIGKRALEFDFIGTDLNKLKGRNALFINSLTDVNDDTDEQAFVKELQPFFSSIEQIPPIVVKQHGKVIRKFLVFRCMDYHPPEHSN